MPLEKTLFKVLLSSPSDVNPEREIVKKIISEINETYKLTNFGLQLISWEDDISPKITLSSGQYSIDEVFKYDESELLIGIFYKKLGTPVLHSKSGTIHEITKAIESYKIRKQPEIKLYFKKISLNISETTKEDRDNFEKMEEIKQKYMKIGILNQFDNDSEFETLFRQHLLTYFNKKVEEYRNRIIHNSNKIIVKTRKHFERMEEIVERAKNNIYILGINLEGALNIRDLLKMKANNGVNVNLIALDPNGSAIKHFKINNVSISYRKKKIISNLEILSKEFKDWPNIKLHVVDRIFTNGCTGIDVGTSYGRIIAQLYLNEIGTSETPILDIYSDTNNNCFYVYSKYLYNLLDISREFGGVQNVQGKN